MGYRFEHQAQAGSAAVPEPFCSALVPLNSIDFPKNMDNEDDKRQNEAEQEPVVHEFQISCLRQVAGDALEQRVHDQQSGQSNLK